MKFKKANRQSNKPSSRSKATEKTRKTIGNHSMITKEQSRSYKSARTTAKMTRRVQTFWSRSRSCAARESPM